jgi:rSAM/selenodomain-associated transferase 1
MSRSLLLFAKEPRPGRVKTRLVPPLTPEEAASISAAFLEDLVGRLGRLPEVDFGVALPPEDDPLALRRLHPGVRRWVSQGTGSLGERLQRTTAAEFAEGASTVTVIGSDHPNIPGDGIRRCLDAADRGRAGWIRTEDGGYAVLALPRCVPRIFEDVPWSTERVARTTLERARESDLVLEDMGLWYDVDRIEDLTRLACDLDHDPDVCPRTRELLGRWRPAFEKRGILPATAPHERSAP